MGDDMHHPPPRRHFLRRAISVAGAAPLSSRLGLAAGAGAALVAT
ncbi:gluconate 2-dehydrogenase subunit 3 family protein, partial [Verminephrobacter sp. Larva24]